MVPRSRFTLHSPNCHGLLLKPGSARPLHVSSPAEHCHRFVHNRSGQQSPPHPACPCGYGTCVQCVQWGGVTRNTGQRLHADSQYHRPLSEETIAFGVPYPAYGTGWLNGSVDTRRTLNLPNCWPAPDTGWPGEKCKNEEKAVRIPDFSCTKSACWPREGVDAVEKATTPPSSRSACSAWLPADVGERKPCSPANSTARSGKIEEVSRETGEDTRETCEVTREVGEVTRESGEVTRESGEVKRESGEVTRESGEVTRESGEVTREYGDLTRETGKVTTKKGQFTWEISQITRETDQVPTKTQLTPIPQPDPATDWPRETTGPEKALIPASDNNTPRTCEVPLTCHPLPVRQDRQKDSKGRTWEERITKDSANLCQVCGDTASGNFFNAVVCLPCKSFFIRCTKDGEADVQKVCKGDCDVSKEQRHRCQYCRFQRCRLIGMARKEKPEVVVAGKDQRLCQVCGDLANGIHFGVFTCEGCKKFFRRGLKEHEGYVCRAETRCSVNPRNRNHCRFCRYQKCLDAGMSRQAIKMGRPRKCIDSLHLRSPSESGEATGGHLPDLLDKSPQQADHFPTANSQVPSHNAWQRPPPFPTPPISVCKPLPLPALTNGHLSTQSCGYRVKEVPPFFPNKPHVVSPAPVRPCTTPSVGETNTDVSRRPATAAADLSLQAFYASFGSAHRHGRTAGNTLPTQPAVVSPLTHGDPGSVHMAATCLRQRNPHPPIYAQHEPVHSSPLLSSQVYRDLPQPYHPVNQRGPVEPMRSSTSVAAPVCAVREALLSVHANGVQKNHCCTPQCLTCLSPYVHRYQCQTLNFQAISEQSAYKKDPNRYFITDRTNAKPHFVGSTMPGDSNYGPLIAEPPPSEKRFHQQNLDRRVPDCEQPPVKRPRHDMSDGQTWEENTLAETRSFCACCPSPSMTQCPLLRENSKITPTSPSNVAYNISKFPCFPKTIENTEALDLCLGKMACASAADSVWQRPPVEREELGATPLGHEMGQTGCTKLNCVHKIDGHDEHMSVLGNSTAYDLTIRPLDLSRQGKD